MQTLKEFQRLLRCKDSAPDWLKNQLPHIEPIGSGAFSTVFALNDQFVLKILTEKTTLTFAKWVRDEQPEGFAAVKEVWDDVVYIEGCAKETLSVIVQERCTPDNLGIAPLIHTLNNLDGGRWHTERYASVQKEKHNRFLHALLNEDHGCAQLKTLKSVALWVKHMQQLDPSIMLDVQSEENWARNKMGNFVLIDPVA